MEKVVADKPRHSLEGLVGTPIPRHSVHTLKHSVPRTEQHWGPRAAPQPRARRDGPSSPTCAAWGGRGRGSWGKGGLCLPYSPVETAGGRVGGQDRCGPAAFPTTMPPALSPPSPSGHRNCGLEEGAHWKASRSQHSPPGTQASQTVPTTYPGI